MADLLAAALRPGRRLTVVPRTVRSASPLTVDVTGEAVAAVDATGGALILPGDLVLVAEGQPRRVLSVVTARAARGTVTAVAAPLATVSVGGVSVALSYVGSAPTVGATVGIVWDAAGSYIVGTLSTATATNPSVANPDAPIPTVRTSAKTYTLTARAIAVASAAGGSWTSWGSYGTTAVQGALSGTNYKSGFYFYGSQFGGAPGRVCLGTTLTLKRGPSGLGSSAGTPAHLRLHTGTTKGSVPPPLTADAELVGAPLSFDEVEVIDLGAAWGQKLLDGTASGIAVVYSGTSHYCQFTGLDSFAASGQITLTIQEA